MCDAALDGAHPPSHIQTMQNSRVAGLTWALTLGACSLGTDDGAQMQGGQTGDEFDELVQRVVGEAPRVEADGSHASDAADELSTLSWTFYQQAAPAADNFVYSPYSLATAAAMLYAGAVGSTQSEMGEVFAFSEEGDAFHQARNDLIHVLDSRNVTATEQRNAQVLKISNDFWMAERLVPTDSFLNVLSAYYGAPVFLFQGGPDEVRKAINGKVGQDTMGLIPELLPVGSIVEDTIFVLTNALYFKANWLNQFDKERTAQGEFADAGGAPRPVEFMHLLAGEGFEYGDVDGTDVLVMPYFGNELEFVALAPPRGEFEAFRSSLTEANVGALLEGAEFAALNLGFPKMEVSFTLPLKKELIEAGMVSAFDSGLADFSALASNPLWIDAAFHQTKVILDEEGTEAAAATAFVARDESAGPTPIDVTIDRAFVFFIRDVQTGAILFLGQYVGPS